MQSTLPAHRVEITLQLDGTLTLDRLPFLAGQAVEVIILPLAKKPAVADPYPLRGVPIQHERPCDPVAEEDWEAM
jgi:hypothetical protein